MAQSNSSTDSSSDTLFFDLETARLPMFADRDPDQFNYIEHSPIAVAIIQCDRYMRPRNPVVVVDREQAGAITERFWKYWEFARRPVLSGWNIRGFDIPVLEAEAIQRGIDARGWLQQGAGYKLSRNRYSDASYDLMEYASNFGAVRNLKLDDFAKRVGIPGKIGHGSDVSGMSDEDLKSYVLVDTMICWAIALKIAIAQGAPGFAPGQADIDERAPHRLLVAGAISLGDYCEREGLAAAKRWCNELEAASTKEPAK